MRCPKNKSSMVFVTVPNCYILIFLMRCHTALHLSGNFMCLGFILLLLISIKEVAKSISTEMLISSQKYDQS